MKKITSYIGLDKKATDKKQLDRAIARLENAAVNAVHNAKQDLAQKEDALEDFVAAAAWSSSPDFGGIVAYQRAITDAKAHLAEVEATKSALFAK